LTGVSAALQRLLLQVWRRVPRLGRRWIVRIGAPSYTVGAACVIERDDGAVLLVRLAYREGWGLPGGLIKRHEEVADCARREVQEEVGLDVDLLSEPAVVVDSRPQRIDVVYRARPAAGVDPASATPRSAEIREVRWFPADELPPLQHESVAALVALAASVGAAGAGTGTGPSGDAVALGAAARAAEAQWAARPARGGRRRAADPLSG
jgi:ADP-ribose pyrophosphatase YjhB (NUDIX family)